MNNHGAGLSPLVRGKPGQVPLAHQQGGSIPACAGETARRAGCQVIFWVYPRLCGGNFDTIIVDEAQSGLSPLVRGKLQLLGARAASQGSIPACAGETVAASVSWKAERVYPRLCGGNMDRLTEA